MATKESMEIVARTVRVDFGELPEKRSKDNDEVSSGEGTVVSSDWCVPQLQWKAAVVSHYVRCLYCCGAEQQG